MSAAQDRLARLRSRAERKLTWEAGRYAARHTTAAERLAALTPIAATATEPTFLVWTKDREMSPTILRTGGYDGEELAWALEHLGHPQRGRRVVEVGANIGTTTVPLLTTYGAERVDAFEPEPANARLLRCNLVLNDVDQRASVHACAVSDAEASLALELCEWNAGDHRIRASDPTGERLGESGRASVTVAATTLDTALGSDLADVGLVWVDTQGHEAHVLAGARRLLDAHVPWVIEYWPYGLTRAGGLDRLHQLIGTNFASVVDVRRSVESGRAVVMAPDEVARGARQTGESYTDLILIP